VIPDPKMTLLPISPTGNVTVEFNQDMVVPNINGQNWYARIFAISIESAVDGSVIFASFNRKVVKKETGKRYLFEEDEEDEDQTESSKLLFDLQLLEHTPRRISIQLDF